ncbi:hypothetical protein ACFQ14_14330, partial [Pseudahrensia aquimaris]
ATGTPARGTLAPAPAAFSIPIAPAPGIEITKVADKTVDAIEGDVITYTYTLRNTGNVTLDSVAPTDNHVAAGTLGPITPAAVTLEPGDEQVFTASYTVLQADIDAGTAITNTATANATPRNGTLTPPTADAQVSVSASTPTLTITKTPSVLSDADVGDTVTYTYEVVNTGNITIDDVLPVDAHNGA